MSNTNLQLSFVANNGKAYTQDSSIGQKLGFITWTPSTLRIMLPSDFDGNELTLTQKPKDNQSAIELPSEFESLMAVPKILFYNDLTSEGVEQLTLQIKENQSHVDVYIGGLFQENYLYNGASPQEKDITINASLGSHKDATIDTMIRIRRNANQLTAKAKSDYINALSNINERDLEGIAVGIYSTDFFQMHVKGSKSIAHGSSVFLPWHRLYLLDLERQLQRHSPEVSLHYWKFDEAAPHIFKADFLGESVIKRDATPLMTEGFSENFARFNDDNPLKNWAIGREKLIRRFTWFENQNESSGYGKGNEDFYLKNEHRVYFRDDNTPREKLVVKKEYDPGYFGQSGVDTNNLESFSWLEINPHGEAHVSINGFLNYVPTAPKDPLFFFLHSNVERFWAKWQAMDHKRYDIHNNDAYPEFDPKDWKNIHKELWPWEKISTPNQYRMLPPGSRAENYTFSFIGKIFSQHIPKIEDAVDAFGKVNIDNYLGFAYDDSAAYFNAFTETKHYETFSNSKMLMNMAVPTNTVHQRNKQVLAKIVSDNLELNSAGSSKPNFKLFGNKPASQIQTDFIDLSSFTQYYTDLSYLEAVHNYDINLLGEVEHQFDKIRLKVTENTSISKSLIVYILSVINNEKVQDDNIRKFFDQSTNIFELIEEDESYLNLLITLFCFASNSIINVVYNEKAPANFLQNINGLVNDMSDVDKANKYWALHNLITNAIASQA